MGMHEKSFVYKLSWYELIKVGEKSRDVIQPGQIIGFVVY